MLQRLEQRYGKITPVTEASSAPASRFVLPDGTVFGIIASTTAPFCRSCDRSRITADGVWYRCLYATSGTDLRRLLRQPAQEAEPVRSSVNVEIARAIADGWTSRQDRGAEERVSRHNREAFIEIEELRRDPHLEMHTRGG